MMDEFTKKCIESYFNDMNTINTQKRGYDCNKSAFHAYMNSLIPINQIESQDISNLFQNVDYNLSQYKRLRKIPYKVYYFDNGEFNFPHTHGLSIFLPNNWFKNNTTIHEKICVIIHEIVHIYQRLYKIETHILLLNIWNFKLIELKYKKVDVRKNPDTNNITYADNRNMLLLPIFTDKKIKSAEIGDKRDHPFEIMAYYLSDVILKKTTPSEIENIWIKKFL